MASYGSARANLKCSPDGRPVRLLVAERRVHHSIVRAETNSSFGFNLSWCDRMMETYRAQAAAGHLAMTIGIEHFRSPDEQRLARIPTQPLRNDRN